MTTNHPRTHFAPYGSTNALCDETVPRSVGSEMPYGEYADQRFTVKRARTTCPDCRSRMAGAPDQDHARTAQERAEELAVLSYPMVEKPNKKAFIHGFLARDAEPTTVTAEQIEKAAMDMRDNQSPAHRTDWPFWVWTRLARSAFRAAGFRIKGDEA